MEKIILFGAGRNGLLALSEYGRDKIAYFCDNSVEKQGAKLEGVKVICFEEMVELYHEGYIIMVTPFENAYMIGQLELEGIDDYIVYHNEESDMVLKKHMKDEVRFKKDNDLLDDLVKASEQLDLLQEVSEFAEISAEALRLNREENITLCHRGVGGEGLYYGNLKALMTYAGIPEQEILYAPTVSHEGCMPSLYTTKFRYQTAVIFPGNRYRENIHKRFPYVPVFSVGPYINYVSGIYQDSKVQIIKKKNGNTLLVFLPHTIENIERNYSKYRFIDVVLKLYSDQFQSVMLCVYWADINDPVCKYAIKNGMHIVTAGLRFDANFDRRLKTILELADAVVCGDIGTFISYSLFMDIPIGRVDITDNTTIGDLSVNSELERKLQFSNEYKLYVSRFYEFFDEEIKITNEQKKWMNPYAGFDQIRSKKYIQHIFEVSKDIWNLCQGDLQKYPDSVRQVYNNYNKVDEKLKMSVLTNAVGNYLS